MAYRYPIGIQNFEKIRKEGFVYIDKTDFIYNLVSSGNYYFLSRPRRFGKSLLISTLEAYFQGKKDLFDGLAIAQLEKDWKAYPVLRFDFSSGKSSDEEVLMKTIDYKLSVMEDEYHLQQRDQPTNVRLTAIINAAYQQTGQRVVVLVDEYDSPMLYNLENADMQRKVREIMRNLFSPLKECDPMLQFVLLTGITKFSQMSVFSELNNLQNISMAPKYDAICGITEKELLTQMQPDIEKLAETEGVSEQELVDMLKQRYDGYHFSEKLTDVYNPFSLLNAFSLQKLSNYWFASGTPSFLIGMLQDKKLNMMELEGIHCASSRFDTPVERVEDMVPILYQSGYLTIKNYDRDLDEYELGFPNTEVRSGFANSLMERMVTPSDKKDAMRRAYMIFRRDNDLVPFMDALRTFLSAYPFDLTYPKELHYHIVLYTLLAAFGADVQPQVKSSKGKADLVLKMPKAIYVIELKLDKTADVALQQIMDMGYATPYAFDDRPVIALGVAFSSKTRNIEDWKSQKV